MDANSPMTLRVSVTVAARDGYSSNAVYSLNVDRTLLEHSAKEIEKRLLQVVKTVNEELEHASFLKGHLATAQLASHQIEEKLEAEPVQLGSDTI